MNHEDEVVIPSSITKSQLIMELQETTEREVNLRKINDQLTKIIQNTYEENSNLTLINKLNCVQEEHNKQIQSLKLKQHMLQADYDCEVQQYKNKIQQSTYKLESSEAEKETLKQYIFAQKKQKQQLYLKVKKYEKMIANQQILIDEYRQSIDQQILLEKQVIKAIYAEKELENKRKFEQALKCMQQNYERKLKDLETRKIKQQYSHDLKMLKNFCKNKTNMMNKENISNQTKTLKGPSSYSTLQK